MNRKPDRRDFLKTLGAGAAAFAAPGCSGLPRERSGEGVKRPNFLVLLTDDQQFSTLTDPAVKTPNLDRLARDGTLFTNTYIMGSPHGAVCMPSRAMLLTGRHLFHLPATLVETWSAPEGERGSCPFDTFPELLRRAGYATFGVGKWHNGRKLYAKCFTGGAEIFFGGMSDHMKVPVFDFDPSGEYPAGKKRLGEKFSSTLFCDAAVEFFEDCEDPFLAYISFTAPHDPRMAPKRFADMYPPETISVPENFLPEHPFDNGELRVRDEKLAPFPRTPEIVQEHLSAYYAMVSHTDAEIGRILDALEKSGLAKDTVVIFAADNGLAVGQHGLMGKQSLYEHSVRVPLIMSGPGIPRGERRDALCYLHDVCPTILEMAGLEVPESVESRSLLPLLEGREAALRDSVFFAYSVKKPQRGVLRGRWKLIEYNIEGVRTTQLFDLESDPGEIRNLAGDPAMAERVHEMRSLLKDWIVESGDRIDLNRTDWGLGGG